MNLRKHTPASHKYGRWVLVLASCLPLLSEASDAATSTGDDANTDHARKAKTLSAVEVNGQTSAVSAVAPTQGSTVAIQPQSIISSAYLRRNVPPTGDYSDAISIAPGVSTVAPNGPGLMEANLVTIRGFQDGQYNVTFDGIPWGDSNDFTHHTTSYFTNHDTSGIVVDRGPGTASTLGNATFGGTVAVESISPESKFGIEPYLALGSWNTWLEGARVDTGALSNSGTTAVLNVENSSSDGYLSYAGQRRQNVFAKVVQPLGENTTLTFAGMYNKIHQYVPLGATRAQIQEYGPSFGLTDDPTQQNYYRDTFDRINTFLGYIDLYSEFGGWTVDNKFYTYAYNHFGYNGEDVNGEYPNGTDFGPNDVPGQRMRNTYHSYGDILRVSKDLGPGQLRSGFWYDYQHDIRWMIEVDDTLGFKPNPDPQSGSAIDDRMTNTLRTFQPFLEYVWNVTDAFSLTGGVKYSYFKRDLHAEVNQKTGAPLDFTKSWSKALPSVAGHWQITDQWTAYAQYAKGFLAPNLNTFYTTAPSLNSIKPEGTINKQIGTTWANDRLSVSGDAYYIDFSNKIVSRTVGNVTQFFNAGGAVYKGLEAEATYLIGAGLSVYANASLNRAIDNQTRQWLPNAPHKTAALGVIYQQGPIYASLIGKFVGHRFGDTGQTQPLGGYTLTNAAFGYTFPQAIGALKELKVGMQLSNLFDKRSIYALAGYTVQDGTPLYYTIPERSVEITLSAKL